MAKPSTEGVTTIAERLAELQRRKATVNKELTSHRNRVAVLQEESEALAKEHLQLLRKFDSVALLP